MNTLRNRSFLALFLTVLLGAAFVIDLSPAQAVTTSTDIDPVATYKTKCSMCHTATAGKFFDTEKTDEDLVHTVMKGKKGEKPPYMPEFESKGITETDAAALVTHMRALRTAAK